MLPSFTPQILCVSLVNNPWIRTRRESNKTGTRKYSWFLFITQVNFEHLFIQKNIIQIKLKRSWDRLLGIHCAFCKKKVVNYFRKSVFSDFVMTPCHSFNSNWHIHVHRMKKWIKSKKKVYTLTSFLTFQSGNLF